MSLTKQLTQNFANSELGCTMLAVALGIITVCGGITGCGNGETTETKVVEVTETVYVTPYEGESIYFELGGNTYEGRVDEAVSADEVLVTLTDGSEMVINIDRIGGTLIADHPDLDARVRMHKEDFVSYYWGSIKGVYSDGMCKIRLVAIWNFKDRTNEKLDPPLIRFARKARNDDEYLKGETYAFSN